MERRTRKVSFLLGMMICLVALLPCLTLPAMAEETATDPEPVCYEHGDVNGDGGIDSRDAVYVLYHDLFKDDPNYAISQDCDFNGDGELTSQDAIYVLYASFGGKLEETHPLNGTVHQYYEPQWSWAEDGDAKVTLKCGCGKTKVLTQDDGLTVKQTKNTAPTCVDAGVVEYTASVTYGDTVFTDTNTILTPASGHNMEGVQGCETSSECTATGCDYKLEPFGHDWVLDEAKSTPATCTAQAVQVYRCACGKEQEITLEGYAEHSYVLTEEVEALDNCQYQQVLKCACDAETLGEVYTSHVYSAALTKEATCRTEGEKTFTCVCGDSYTESVPVNDSHSWVEGDTVNNITTYTCACGESKTAVRAEGDTAAVTKEDLAASTEVQIQDVSISLDDSILSGLNENVQIQVTTTTAAELPVGKDVKDQIGSNPVYDFTMLSDDAMVSDLGGNATISVPYTLQLGDDVDCIDIWFIADDGTLTCVQGTYSNGYVTFTTTHFSYYTVTRLTPAQRCATYGHAIAKSHVDATCTREGYHKEICQRCGYEQVNEALPKIDHDYQEKVTAATCTSDGSFTKTCASCRQTISGTIPALGHNWQKDENKSAEASCEAAGKTVYVCINDGCDASYIEELAQLEHDFGDTEETKADCGSQGHKKRVCKLCGFEEIKDKTAPTGHDYLEENVVWEWAEDYSSATATLVCSYNKNHTKTLRAVITSDITGEACQGTGQVVYTAAASFNKYTYTDKKTVDQDQAEHQPGEKWLTNATQHYQTCEECGAPVNSGSHVWGQETVVTEPTCSKDGLAKQSCTICGYSREVVLEATREHDYVNGVCKDCGFAENSCNHIRTHKTPLDLSAYDVCEGTDIRWVSCDCGEVRYLYVQSMFCNMEYSEREETLPSGDTCRVGISSCRDCGLVTEHLWRQELDKETCFTTEVEIMRIIFDGGQIASSHQVWTESEGSGQHMANIPGETIDLSQYGDLCGTILQERHCYCGERHTVYIEESNCMWEYVEAESSNALRIFRCRVCGAVRKLTETRTSTGEDCTVAYTSKTVVEVDGQEIYSFTNQEIWIEHAYELVEKELDGDSCEDGVYLKQVCRVCDKVHEQYSDYHMVIEQTATELEGFCVDALIQSVCPCGQRKDCFLVYSEHGGEWEYIDESTDRCMVCGLTEIREFITGEKDENCRILETTRYTYQDANGKTVATGEAVYSSTEHNWDSKYELLGKNCEDGVKVSRTCKDCGFRTQYTTNDHTQYHIVYDLAEYGLCGGQLEVYSCPCGKNSGNSFVNQQCEWQHVSGGPGKIVQYCPLCGVTRTRVETEPEAAGSCLQKFTMTFTYTKDDQTLLEVVVPRSEENHRAVYTLKLLGDSCENGYRVTEKCLTCGETDEWTDYDEDHGIWAVERKWLSQGVLCGDLELVTYSCACGEVTEQNVVWHGGECDFGKPTLLDEEQGVVATCSQCGAVKNWILEEKWIPGTCMRVDTNTVTIKKNGTTLCSYEIREVFWEHKYVSSFRLFGDTCADGFERTDTCFDCGKTRVVSQYGGNCDSMWFTTALEVLYDGDDICGPILKRTGGCACGQRWNTSINEENCQFEMGWWDEDMELHSCRECGLIRGTLHHETAVPDSCDVIVQETYIYTKDDAELLREEYSYTTKRHEYVTTFELLGSTCEEGYYVTEVCARCGYEISNNGLYIDHGTWQTEYYDLRDYGRCGGAIWCSGCACGKVSEWHYNQENCDWMYIGQDETTGLGQYRCSMCNTVLLIGDVGSAVENSCDWKGTFYAKLTRDGETLLDLQKPVTRKEHRYAMDSVELYDPALGCEGGYQATMKCVYCDDFYWTNGTDHYCHEVAYQNLQDLYEGACDGYVSLRRCACGAYSELDRYGCHTFTGDSYEMEGSDGYTHTINKHTCVHCGMLWTEDCYTEKQANSCLAYWNNTITLSAKGQELKSWTTRTRQDVHTYEYAYSLMPGASSCEDGLMMTETCKYCDYENTWHYGSSDHSHYNLDLETSIDLAQYGSVCGGTLARYVCPCGQQQRYDFTPETLCDIDRQSIANWVPGTIDTWQYTSEGYVETYSNSYLMVCAVTEPDCDLKIRMSEYWLEENCMATEYQTWQLGYDDFTGTCAYEFTIETGDKHAYHPYEESSTSTEGENGTQVNTNTYLCTQCGSSYVEEYHYRNGNHVKTVERAVNTLNNGEKKSYSELYDYGLQHANYNYITLERYDTTYADGSVYWYQHEHTYDFTNGCRRTVTYTDSDGGYSVREEDAHMENWTQETVKKSTCTQFGEYWEGYTCAVCGLETYRYQYETVPVAHSWWWSDDKQCYVCGICGLENINGASGEIVLEDMTDSYGAGENYVVGYWNRGSVNALRYVGVVLKDVAEGENDELVLTDIEFTDWSRNQQGITAVVFSREAVAASAQRAVEEAGYTGDYAIRFTFVPKDAADTLDYAITFDDLNT